MLPRHVPRRFRLLSYAVDSDGETRQLMLHLLSVLLCIACLLVTIVSFTELLKTSYIILPPPLEYLTDSAQTNPHSTSRTRPHLVAKWRPAHGIFPLLNSEEQHQAMAPICSALPMGLGFRFTYEMFGMPPRAVVRGRKADIDSSMTMDLLVITVRLRFSLKASTKRRNLYHGSVAAESSSIQIADFSLEET